MKEIIFATGNKGKLQEVRNIFRETDIKIFSPADLGKMPDIIEDADTFEGNAWIKAEKIYDIFGKPVMADDSGLAVDQLDGRPGVFSARYAGENCTYEDNNIKLIEELSYLPEPHTAKFVCVAVFYNGFEKHSARGEVSGRIIKKSKGEKGFGYDPIFVPDGYGITMAEMELSEKNSISHRSIAFRKLREIITGF